MEHQNPTPCSGSCGDCAGGCPGSAAGNGFAGKENSIVTLFMEDGTQMDCMIAAAFPMDGADYMALLPVDDYGQPLGGDVLLYRMAVTPEGEPTVDNITDDAEYARVTEVFARILDAAAPEEEAEEAPEAPQA